MNRILRNLGGIVGGLCPISGAAHAQWTVTNLHPAGAIRSTAYDVHAGQQVGYASIGDWATWHAALWKGTAASFVDLHPVGATRSVAGSAYNGQQVGFAVFG